MSNLEEPLILTDGLKRSGDTRWVRRDEIWHAVQAYRTADKSITNGVTVVMDWDAEHFDTNNLHDNSINNGRFTAALDGLYIIYWSLRVGSGYTNPTVIPRKNGTVSVTDILSITGNSNLIGQYGLQLNKGDYVELLTKHDNATPQTILCSSVHSYFGMFRVG
jgi:hypothetical protein